MREMSVLREMLVMIQGHPYSNDDGDGGVHVGPKGVWIIVVLIGVGLGIWLLKNKPPGRGK